MAKSKTKMIIEINEPILSKVIAVRGDANSRFIDVQLYNDGVPVDLNGHTVTMSVKTNPKSPMKNPVDEFISGTIPDPTNGRCMFPLTTSMLAEEGALDAQISVFSGEQEVLSTLTFIIYIEPSIRSDEQIEAENEFGVLVVLFSEIQNALDDLHAITLAFGEPSEESIAEGTDTFWKVLEKNIKDISAAVAYDLPEKIGEPDDTSSIPTMFGKIKLNNELIEATIGGEKKFETPGPFEFTVPDHINLIEIVAAGGGGGGGSVSGTSVGSNGGGGGACSVLRLSVSPGEKITGTVGTGGASGGSSSYPTDGTPTVINDILTLPGGKSGKNNGGESGGEGGGKGGTGGSGGVTNGENGLFGRGGLKTTDNQRGGGGGGGSYGKGGNGGSRDDSLEPTAGVHGGGGGGAYSQGNSGKGGDGVVLIRWGNLIGKDVPLS